jgi:hypothetical protein
LPKILQKEWGKDCIFFKETTTGIVGGSFFLGIFSKGNQSATLLLPSRAQEGDFIAFASFGVGPSLKQSMGIFPARVGPIFPAKTVDFCLKYCIEGQNPKIKSTGRSQRGPIEEIVPPPTLIKPSTFCHG